METSVNRKDLVGLGPTRKNPVPDPLAVLHLDNIYICRKHWVFPLSLLGTNICNKTDDWTGSLGCLVLVSIKLESAFRFPRKAGLKKEL